MEDFSNARDDDGFFCFAKRFASLGEEFDEGGHVEWPGKSALIVGFDQFPLRSL